MKTTIDARRRVLLAVRWLGPSALVMAWAAWAAQSRDPGLSAGPSAPSPQFDVAGIHRNDAGSGVAVIRPLPDGLQVRFCTVQMLIEWAYVPFGSPRYSIASLPKWAATDRYDIDARAGPAETEELKKLAPDERESALALMLRTLLKDRFHLVLHRRATIVPGYELILADRMHGLAPDRPNDPELPRGSIRLTPGSIAGQGVTMTRLAETLEGEVRRPVEDKTGLTGTYDFSLQWRPLQNWMSDPSGSDGSDTPTEPPLGMSSPSIFVALRDQLGLALRSTTTTGEVLVVDLVERPTPN